MPLYGLTAAQWKFAKTLLRGAGQAIPAGLAWLSHDLAAEREAAVPLEWRRFCVQYTRGTPAGTREDKAQFKLDIINVTADELDVTWTAADYTAVKNALAGLAGDIQAQVSTSYTMSSIVAYAMAFNPSPDLLRPFVKTGPPVDVATYTTAGTGSAGLPYQVAPAVTFRTGWPKHWGRIYLPTPGTASIDSLGRLTAAYRNTTSAAVKTRLSGLIDLGFYPVVPVGQLDKSPFHALLGISQIVVDDVPDIQRRRRPKQVVTRTVA
jgi:hypothetical protein